MKCRLSDIVDIIGGGTPKTSVLEYWDGDIPWLSVKDFNNDHRYVYTAEKHISKLGLAESAACLLKEDDCIISARGTVGELAMIPYPMAFNQSCYGLRAKEGIVESKYLYYLVKNKVRELRHNTHGTVFDTITRDTFDGIEVALPPLETQRKIASILSSLDDKIELNNRINANLEEQAKAIFKSWFVDFEPFGGTMPEGWTTADIYSIAKIVYGAPFSSKLFNTDGIGVPIVRIRDLHEQKFSTFTTEEHPRGHLIRAGDIVVGMDGEFRPYLWGNDPAWLNQRICIFENKRPKGKFFLLSTIRPLLERIEKTQVGTTVIHIGKKDFDAFRIQLPDENTLSKFDELTYPLFEKIIANLRENARLSSLRDALLPRLLSGELDVSKLTL